MRAITYTNTVGHSKKSYISLFFLLNIFAASSRTYLTFADEVN